MQQQNEPVTGSIFDIQRFSIHDGPGIRTTVFFKGCPLRCLWCHNPESRSAAPQVAFYASKCIGCGRCAKACVCDAILSGDSRINRARCGACGACARECPSGALEKIGRIATVEEVVSVVERDRPFYDTSKGGATLSGGEPFYQFDFAMALLSAFREKKISTAVESCLLTQWEKINAARSLVDIWLCDIKAIDSQKHKNLCGVENSLILENARKLAATGADVTFRTPLVPGCNDSADDIRALGEFVASIPNARLQLMPYHGIGVGKYDALGIDYTLRDTEAPENLSNLISTLRSMGVNMIEE